MRQSAGASMAWGSTLSFARLVSGLIRVKVVALALGVRGVGIFSLLQQVNLTGISIVGMSLAIPIINLGRPRLKQNDVETAGRIVGTALAIVVFNAMVVLVVAALVGNQLFRLIGTGPLKPQLVGAIFLSILLGALASSFWEGMSYLADRFDIYVRVGVAGTVADMVCVASGAWLYGLKGAVAAMPLGPLVLFGSYTLLLSRDSIARRVLRNLSVGSAELPQLLTYSAIMFAAVALTNVGLTAVRAKVLVDAGAQANGYLQTVTSLSAYILAFVTTGFWGHLHARAATEGDTLEVRAELHQALRLGLLISFTGCGTALVLSNYFIPLFFSGQFTGASLLMIAYMPGEFCYQLVFLLTAYQLTISRRRRYLAWSLGYIGLLVTIGTIAIPRYGAAGYVGSHITGAVAMLAVTGFTCWRNAQVRLSILAMAACLAILLAGMAILAILLHSDRAATPVNFLGLLPVAITGAIAAKELFSGAKLHQRESRTGASIR